jgi:hypothetical protein
MKKAVFSIDGGNTDFTFVGYSSNMYWNGWSVPYFSETTIKKIFDQDWMFQNEDSESILSFEDGVLYEMYDGEKVVISSGVYFDVNGERHYAFDCGWCWGEVTSIGQLAEICESFDNGNGDWEYVREDEREYLIETIEFHSLNK